MDHEFVREKKRHVEYSEDIHRYIIKDYGVSTVWRVKGTTGMGKSKTTALKRSLKKLKKQHHLVICLQPGQIIILSFGVEHTRLITD